MEHLKYDVSGIWSTIIIIKINSLYYEKNVEVKPTIVNKVLAQLKLAGPLLQHNALERRPSCMTRNKQQYEIVWPGVVLCCLICC